MPFDDLAAFIAPGFDLPIRGKTYRIDAPSAKDGLYLQAIIDTGENMAVAAAVNRATRRAKKKQPQMAVISAADRTVLSDEEERHTFQLALGDAYNQMIADGVPWPILKHAGITAWLYWARDEQTAERYWSRFGQGKVPAPTATPPTSGDTSPEGQSIPSPA